MARPLLSTELVIILTGAILPALKSTGAEIRWTDIVIPKAYGTPWLPSRSAREVFRLVAQARDAKQNRKYRWH